MNSVFKPLFGMNFELFCRTKEKILYFRQKF